MNIASAFMASQNLRNRLTHLSMENNSKTDSDDDGDDDDGDQFE